MAMETDDSRQVADAFDGLSAAATQIADAIDPAGAEEPDDDDDPELTVRQAGGFSPADGQTRRSAPRTIVSSRDMTGTFDLPNLWSHAAGYPRRMALSSRAGARGRG